MGIVRATLAAAVDSLSSCVYHQTLARIARAQALEVPNSSLYTTKTEKLDRMHAILAQSKSLSQVTELLRSCNAENDVKFFADIKYGQHEIWGCVPKDEDDISKYGQVIAVNAILAEALEDSNVVRPVISPSVRERKLNASQDPVSKSRASFMLAVTVLHGLMHWLHQKVSLTLSYENTPPTLGISSESYTLQQELTGGLVICDFPIGHAFDFALMQRITLRDPQVKLYELSMMFSSLRCNLLTLFRSQGGHWRLHA